jgi:hypothetical protein
MTSRQKIKFWLYGCCPVFAGSFRYFGTRVYFTQRSRTFAAVCRQSIFEDSIVRTLFALSKPDTTVFDVGANLGLMAVPLLAEHDRGQRRFLTTDFYFLLSKFLILNQ